MTQLNSSKSSKNTGYWLCVLGGFSFIKSFSTSVFQKYNPIDLKGFTAVSKGVCLTEGHSASQDACHSLRVGM